MAKELINMGHIKDRVAIDFKFHKSTVEELRRIYLHHLTSFRYTDEHEQLLAEHVKDMYLKLDHMERTMVKTAGLVMNNSEALAFFQLWQLIDTSPWPLANVIICDMIKKIDKRIKEPKKMYANRIG